MVLGALTLMLIALMVFITLAISVRIHERQDLQTAADAAAFSQAVATARAFNAVSAENRVLVAQMSSVAAAQSMLSWIAFYHGVLNQARDALGGAGGLNRQPACGAFGPAVDNIMAEDTRLIRLFEEKPSRCNYDGRDGLDALSAEYVRTDLYETALIIADNQRELYGDMVAELPNISTRIARAAATSDPFASTNQEFEVESRHRVTDCERDGCGSVRGVVVAQQQKPFDMVRATMATRGQDPFVSSRPRKLAHQGVERGGLHRSANRGGDWPRLAAQGQGHRLRHLVLRRRRPTGRDRPRRVRRL
jgi:hypothetical protein